MAKYVGHIFKVNNAALGIKRSGSHYVHVKWFNPFSRKFWCKIITSLEERKSLDQIKASKKAKICLKGGGDDFYIFAERKYAKLRNGEIVPIPVDKTEGFSVWSGYYGSRYLARSKLKGNRKLHMKIKK